MALTWCSISLHTILFSNRGHSLLTFPCSTTIPLSRHYVKLHHKLTCRVRALGSAQYSEGPLWQGGGCGEDYVLYGMGIENDAEENENVCKIKHVPWSCEFILSYSDGSTRSFTLQSDININGSIHNEMTGVSGHDIAILRLAILGRRQYGLMRWILLWIMPLVQNHSDLLTSSPVRYHCTKAPLAQLECGITKW